MTLKFNGQQHKAIVFFALGLVVLLLQQTTSATTSSTASAGTAAAGTSATGVSTKQCEYPPLLGQIPSLFNVLVLEDFVGGNSVVGGRLAAGGNIALTSYSVATEIPFIVCPAQNSAPSSNTTGEWFDNLVVGGVLFWSGGSLGSGNIIVGDFWQVSPSVTASVKQPCSIRMRIPTGINFFAEIANIVQLSANLARVGQGKNVTATLDHSNILTIPLDLKALENSSIGSTAGTEGTEGTAGASEQAEDNIQVIDVNAADLLKANTVTYQGATAGTVPSITRADATPSGTSGTAVESANKTVLVFNVHGTPCGFQNASLQSLAAWSKKIIWNFLDCTAMSIQEVSVPGTLLAPLAEVNGNSGILDGQLIALGFSGSLVFMNTLFEGCVNLGNATGGTAGTQ